MKLTALALVAVLSGASLTAPALAGDSYGFDAGNFITQLRYDGVNAIDADDYSNGRVRVLVQLDDGSRVVQFFDRDNYQLIAN